MNTQLPQQWVDQIDQDNENFKVVAGIIERLAYATFDPEAHLKESLSKLFTSTGVPYHG